MANVWMFVEKFDREVLIDEDHPLAIAQRGDTPDLEASVGAVPTVPVTSAITTDTQSGASPAVTVTADGSRARKRKGNNGSNGNAGRTAGAS